MKNKLIEVKNLNIRYIKKKFIYKSTYTHIIKDISFNLIENECLGIIGESGCGKTTLAFSLLKLKNLYQTGSIKLFGNEVCNLTSKQFKKYRSNIQMIFQNSIGSLDPSMTISESIKEAILHYKPNMSDNEIKNSILDIFTHIKLPKYVYDKYPYEMSGGQCQRANIARVLILKPKIIIFDESISSIDPYTQYKLINLLNELKVKYSLTYIFISHDIALLSNICSNIMVLNKGEIVEYGICSNIIKNPSHSITKKLIQMYPVSSYKELEYKQSKF